MTRGQSRLWRKLNPSMTHGHIFRVDSEALGTLYDADIHSIKITRGADSPNPGLSPSLVEIQLAGARWPKTNSAYGVYLGNGFATANDLPLTRAIGRVGSYETDDQGGSKFRTTFQGAHWSSLLTLAGRTIQPTAGQGLTDLVKRAVYHPELQSKYGVIVPGISDDTVHATEDWTATREVIDKYGTGTGMQLRETRIGTMELVTMLQRAHEAEVSRIQDLPILRRNGIAPATWNQSVDGSNVQYTLTRVVSSGVPYTQTWPLPANVPLTVLEKQDVDWSNIKATTDNYRLFMQARNLESNWPENGLRSLRLDLTHLLSSPTTYDRRIAKQVINYEVGTHVMLGGDWPVSVRGRYFANQITEEITPTGWVIELALTPASRVTGMSYSDSQNVPAYTWDQMNSQWNNTPGSWSTYALPA